jgi:hypothetical protein
MLHSQSCAPRSGFVNVDIVVCGVVWAANFKDGKKATAKVIVK